MNLESKVEERLWQMIQGSYENRNYTGAILDTIYFLSDLVREKSGLSSDGISLIGQAFGGKSPKLKINKLQSDSDKNIQSGIAQILRGLYQAIRNLEVTKNTRTLNQMPTASFYLLTTL